MAVKNFVKAGSFFLVSLLFVGNVCFAAEYYLAPDGSDAGDGSILQPWSSLNYALNKYANDTVNARVAPGDTLYLRGGVYSVPSMFANGDGVSYISTNTNINSPTTTIKSYPGEWAIFDGGGTHQILVAHGTQYNVVFENFEIRNGFKAGFAFGDGYDDRFFYNSIFRNLYFHDNTSPNVNNNPAGLKLSGDSCIIEYCTFEDNGTPLSTMHNSANLLLFNRYADYPEPEPRKNNIIRYNKFIGSASQIKDKGDSNFVDNANPNTSNSDWANDIHHNVFTGALGQAYYSVQDFIKFHHNLVLNSSKGGVILYKPDEVTNKTIWWGEVYNNTFVNITEWAIKIGASERVNTDGSPGDDLRNNLFVNSSADAIWLWITTTTNFTITSDYNVWDDAFSTVGRRAHDSAASLTTWRGYGYDVHSMVGAVSFVDSGNNDYRLVSGSAGVSGGKDGANAGAFGNINWYSQAGFNKNLGTATTPNAPNAPDKFTIES